MRGMINDRAAAIGDYQQFVDDTRRVFGPDHPATFATRDNLARWQEQAS